MSENNLSGTHTALLVIPQMRYGLPEIVSPFGLCSCITAKGATESVPGLVLQFVSNKRHLSSRRLEWLIFSSRINVTEAAWTQGVA